MVTDESRLPIRYTAFVFDRSFERRQTIALTGPPIRVRVAPDGRRAALTVFERGHSYADEAFSTPWPYAGYPAALPHVLGVSALTPTGNVPVGG